MDSHEMYMLSSHHQAFSAEGEAFCGSSSRILQNSSGNLGLKATSVLESDDDDGRDTKEAPSIFEGPQRKSHYKHVSRQPAERLHRRRLYPWELDRNFIRYENQSERYRQYRDKARQNNEQKWPDDVEDALQHALRLIRVLGRKKEVREDYNGAHGGRNELIQDYILRYTGVLRTRKQVSSHLQVLKNYLKDNAAWMRFVTKEDDQPEYRPAYLRTSLVTETVGKYSYSSRHASNSKPIPPSTPILGSNVAPSVNQFDFEMFVENKSKERYHTYTCIQSDIGSTSRALHDVANWRDSYPRLASDYLDNRSDGELILVESNLDLLRDYPPSGSKLGNHSSIQINRGAKYSEWQSRTFLYEHGVQVTGERNNIDWDDQPVPLDAVDIDSTNATKIVLRLSCSWWASNVFSKILNDARRAQSQGDAYAIQQAEEAGRQFLEGMSMMQEISAWPGRDTNSPQTIAILLWKFRQTRNQEAATTTWRKLTLPCVRDAMSISAQFSGPTTLQSSLSIDTSLQDMLAVQQAPIYTDLSRHNSLFVDDPESIITGQPSDIDSTLSTPTPDMRSLPSSTATSFASSNSGCLHLSHYTPESSLSSQESAHYSHHGNVHSQEAIYSTQEPEYNSQNAAYIAPELERLAQEPYYPAPSQPFTEHDQGPDEAIFELHEEYAYHEAPIEKNHHLTCDYNEHNEIQQPLDADVTQSFARRLSYNSQGDQYSQENCTVVAKPNPQDFNGGRIHISFADELHQDYSFDQNHLALPASMLSHQESFDSQYEDNYQEAHQHEQEGVGIGSHDALQHDQQRSLAIWDHHIHEGHPPLYDTQHHEEELNEPAFNHASYPSPSLRHSSGTSLVLHHPQPQPSLQHHIDSVRWTTHALCAAVDRQSQGSSEDFELIDETLKIESVHEEILEQIPEVDGLDDDNDDDDEMTWQQAQELEQGRILGEVSERLERELEKERERELELELERELGRGMDVSE